MSLSSESRAKCPACRTEGRYQLNQQIDKILSAKHVKCPEDGCSWAGILQDYKWHLRRHDRNEARRSQPAAAVRSRPAQPYVRGASLTDNIDAFADRLRTRRHNIQAHYSTQEDSHRESIEEVENLSRRLGTVANNIVHLLDNMHHDSRRLQRYMDETNDILPQVEVMPLPTARSQLPRLSSTHMTSSAHCDLPQATARSTSSTRVNSPRSEARLQRLMLEPISPTTTSNPFLFEDTLSLATLHRTPSVQDRLQHLLAEPTPTSNPFTLPDDLLVLRPPTASLNTTRNTASRHDSLTEQLQRERSSARSTGSRSSTNRNADHNRHSSHR